MQPENNAGWVADTLLIGSAHRTGAFMTVHEMTPKRGFIINTSLRNGVKYINARILYKSKWKLERQQQTADQDSAVLFGFYTRT